MMSLLAVVLPAYTPSSGIVTPTRTMEVEADPTTRVLVGVASADALMPSDQCSASTAISKNRNLVAVALGFDSQYWASWQSASGFLPWQSLGGSAFASGPAVVQDAQGDVVVFGHK